MTWSQVAHQLDIKVMEKAHKEVTEDQAGQSSATILQCKAWRRGCPRMGPKHDG